MSNAEALARAFAGWGKDNPANMRELLHPDCELVVPSRSPTAARSAGPTRRSPGSRATCGGGSTSSPPRPRTSSTPATGSSSRSTCRRGRRTAGRSDVHNVWIYEFSGRQADPRHGLCGHRGTARCGRRLNGSCTNHAHRHGFRARSTPWKASPQLTPIWGSIADSRRRRADRRAGRAAARRREPAAAAGARRRAARDRTARCRSRRMHPPAASTRSGTDCSRGRGGGWPRCSPRGPTRS